MRHQFITRPARGPSPSARPNAKDSLADGGVVARVVVETAGRGGGIAVSGTVLVAGTVTGRVVSDLGGKENGGR